MNQRGSQSTGGIGLYLSKNFLELHRGAIKVDSKPGNGSCFKITIPVNLNQLSDMRVIDRNQKIEEENELALNDDQFAGHEDFEHSENTRPTTRVLSEE